MKLRTLFVALVIIISSSGCGLTSLLPANQPSSDAAPAGDQEQILLSDDFSDPGSGWDRDTNDSGTTDYVDGEYQILVNDTEFYLWANPGGSTLTDVSIEADARVVEDKGGDIGLICRYQDEANFYFLRITSDGYYGISKFVEGEETLIGMEQLPSSSAIKAGAETNHLRADCVGNQLSLYANGELLADVEDDSLQTGDVGLLGGTFEQGGNDVRFDNFIVRRP